MPDSWKIKKMRKMGLSPKEHAVFIGKHQVM